MSLDSVCRPISSEWAEIHFLTDHSPKFLEGWWDADCAYIYNYYDCNDYRSVPKWMHAGERPPRLTDIGVGERHILEKKNISNQGIFEKTYLLSYDLYKKYGIFMEINIMN